MPARKARDNQSSGSHAVYLINLLWVCWLGVSIKAALGIILQGVEEPGKAFH
jgi:hypothetical protein